jgi:hypothetical protein
MSGAYDSSNPHHVNSQEKKVKIATRQTVEDLQTVMSTKGGRRFVWNLLSKCGIYEITFTGNSWGNFKEGMRNIGLMLLSDLQEHCMDKYQLMERENLNKTE